MRSPILASLVVGLVACLTAEGCTGPAAPTASINEISAADADTVWVLMRDPWGTLRLMRCRFSEEICISVPSFRTTLSDWAHRWEMTRSGSGGGDMRQGAQTRDQCLEQCIDALPVLDAQTAREAARQCLEQCR